MSLTYRNLEEYRNDFTYRGMNNVPSQETPNEATWSEEEPDSASWDQEVPNL